MLAPCDLTFVGHTNATWDVTEQFGASSEVLPHFAGLGLGGGLHAAAQQQRNYKEKSRSPHPASSIVWAPMTARPKPGPRQTSAEPVSDGDVPNPFGAVIEIAGSTRARDHL
jgi:hypothetical protein